jgi:accessory colonization factor AcfC
MSKSTQGLRIIGRGGPYEAMVECADAFSRSRIVAGEVIKGPPERWLDRRADLIYGGFPSMLTDVKVYLFATSFESCLCWSAGVRGSKEPSCSPVMIL